MDNNQIFIITVTAIAVIFVLYKTVKFWFASHGGNEGWIAQTQPSAIWLFFTNLWWLIFFKLYNRLEIRNGHYVPKGKKDCFVTVANHASVLDGFLMGIGVWNPIYIMVKKEAFEIPIKGLYLRKVFTFPVDRSKVDTAAIKTAMKHLADGDRLGLFPEGTRNRYGYVSEFKPGAIKFALKKKVSIIPAYIYNSHNLTPINSIIPRPVKLILTFLEPIDTKAELESGKTDKDILDMLYKRITDAGREIAGHDVRDPEYLKTLEASKDKE